MKTKLSLKLLISIGLSLSIYCALYLNFQVGDPAISSTEGQEVIAAMTRETFIAFPEVEAIKVFVEKFIAMVTMTTA